MKLFPLLINGEKLDTGRYDYFPYMNRKIENFKEVFQVTTALKMGALKEDDPLVVKNIFAKFCVASEDTNRQAIESAARAFQEFKQTSLKSRKKLLLDIHALLLEKKEELLDLLVIEGHPLKLAEWEFEGMVTGASPETINFYFSQIQREIGRSKGDILYWTRRPDGIVCMSPPGNAAASNSFNATLALMTGNTLIIKPPLRDPISSLFLWQEVIHEVLLRHGMPPGVANVVIGNSKKIFDEWIEDPRVRDFIFFGDTAKGMDLGTRVFREGKKPILEMSGNDVCLVWSDADIQKATDSLLDCFLGSTQICMVPKLGVVHEKVFSAFRELMRAKTLALKVALPTDPDTCLSPVAKIPDYFEFLVDAVGKGAKMVCGGKRVNHRDEEDKNGMYVRPTILEIDDRAVPLQELRCVNEEIFFPLLPLVIVSGNDDEIFAKMIRLVNFHRFGLRASLWVRSPRYLRKFSKELDNCGILRINSRHVGFSPYISTHGGTSMSGGPFGEMNYFWQKTSHLQGVCRSTD